MMDGIMILRGNLRFLGRLYHPEMDFVAWSGISVREKALRVDAPKFRYKDGVFNASVLLYG